VFCPIQRLFAYLRMRMSTSKQHPCVRGPLRECRSIRAGASGLPYYCTPPVGVSVVIGLLVACLYNKPKPKSSVNMSVSVPLDKGDRVRTRYRMGKLLSVCSLFLLLHVGGGTDLGVMVFFWLVLNPHT